MKSTKEKMQQRIIIFLGAVCLLLTVSSAYFSYESGKLQEREKIMNEKAISSLCESLDSISVSLGKSVYTADSLALGQIGNELCRLASCAKESLGQLDFDSEMRDEVYRFLSQVGNFTVAVAQGERGITAESSEKLRSLSAYAEKLSDGLNEICLDYYNGGVSLESASGNLVTDERLLPDDFYKRLYDTAQTMTDYPTLVYDGPFADNISKKKSEFLNDKKEITAREALERAADILGVKQSSLRREEDIGSEPKRYCFSVGGNDITITKKGGYICSLITESFAVEESISTKEAIKRGRKYLSRLGYESMKSSYYSVYDGICTVNFAYSDGGVVCYSDLIKVSIALDTGKLVGLDAKNYLLNHKQRSFPEERISQSDAQKRLSPSLEVIDSQLAVIPLDTGKEAFCYELHCRDREKKEVLVYLDAQTGRQADLLLLLYSDDGILTK